ncbi:2-oxo acid dehydrogenase subunit E2 [Buchnera aphidicola (Kurisakia onigurumii)]|uniref:2-oxo acid dehydrogenase subunit E2 n=1 Tax=Buchnera aphidicola TaxID=9 RepID=UPI0031B73321
MDVIVKIPDIGIEEVEVMEILVQEGTKIKKNEGIITVEGKKASMEIPSELDGIVKKIFVNIGDTVKTGTNIVTIKKISNVIKQNKDNIVMNKFNNIGIQNNNVKKNNYVHASPSVRRISRELGISLKNIIGSGRRGRILTEDIKNFHNLHNNNSNESKKNNFQLTENNKKINLYEENLNFIDLNKIQINTSKNLCKNWNNIPHVTQFNKIDITEIENFRISINKDLSLHCKITLLSFITKSVSLALKKFPKFNSRLDEEKNRIVFNKYVNIGIAIDTSCGLLVPVIKNSDKKSILEIAKEIFSFSEKAKQNKLTILDLQNGSFTISNLGRLGGDGFTPIINGSEVSILGISNSRVQPFWKNNNFIPRTFLPISLTYDHRIINGLESAKFMDYIGKILSTMKFLIF